MPGTVLSAGDTVPAVMEVTCQGDRGEIHKSINHHTTCQVGMIREKGRQDSVSKNSDFVPSLFSCMGPLLWRLVGVVSAFLVFSAKDDMNISI